MSDTAKRAAAQAAARLVEDGMVLGLGTGSTVAFLLEAVAARITQDRLRLRGVPTSLATARRCIELGIPLTDLAADPVLDLAVDGADEIERPGLRLIKGAGGALLREKIVAEAARRFVVIADETKLVRSLGAQAPVPVELVTFGQAATTRRVAALGLAPKLRRLPDGTPFLTDNGNLILDCTILDRTGVDGANLDGAGVDGPGLGMRDAAALADALRRIAGVVETGLFLSGVERALIGGDDGSVQDLEADSDGG